MDDDTDQHPEATDAAALAATVLEEEATRRARQEATEVLFPDDLLPGVKSEGSGLRRGVARGGGPATVIVVLVLH